MVCFGDDLCFPPLYLLLILLVSRIWIHCHCTSKTSPLSKHECSNTVQNFSSSRGDALTPGVLDTMDPELPQSKATMSKIEWRILVPHIPFPEVYTGDCD